MELNKLEFLRRELRTNNQIGMSIYNRPRSINYMINKKIKEEIHTVQNTQARWNARKEKRILNNLISLSVEQPVKRRRI